MQEIYTMILNTSVTTVITIIFLWQYVADIKEKKEKEKETQVDKDKIVEQAKEIIELLKDILKALE